MNNRQNKIKKGSFRYFSDCKICDTMKQADHQGRSLTLGELKTAFKAAKVNKVQ